MLDLDRLVQEIAAKDLRYRRLGFTDEDANRYYDDLYFGATETEAQERLLDGRS